jgi:hypothetical protein
MWEKESRQIDVVYDDVSKAGVNNWSMKYKETDGWWRNLEEIKDYV